ncbi:uncharacterized protein LOC135078262 [Ostrinia nubilalis]|uniref:uncharacterized protein LOC135078262 n=1 Tax=Ostrinia nubilalis TaxID=29057 RepID=UPI0030825465
MLSADEDITTELDRVVCRLMKLALRTTRRRQSPLPMKWMQCKMLDLLNLTEKAIEKKKNHYVETYPLKAICYDDQIAKQEEFNLSKIKEDETANEIVHKYRHLVRSSGNTTSEDMQKYQYYDDISHKSSKEFIKDEISSDLNFEDIIRSPSLVDIEPVPDHPIKPRKVSYGRNDTPLSRTQAWLEEDVKVVRYPKHSAHGISSGDTDHSVNNVVRFKNKKSHRKHKISADVKEADLDVKRRKRSASKTSYDKHKSKNVDKNKNKDKTSKTRLIKKVAKKKSSYNILIKSCSTKVSTANFGNIVKSKRNLKPNVMQPSASKPIPEILMDIINMDTCIENKTQDIDVLRRDNFQDVDSIGEVNFESNIANTEESLLIDIVMDDREETIALRRTIGTEADDETVLFEQETILGSLTNIMKADSFYDKHETENVHSQTIFIYDINEPSTSKGVRHVSMDVQCGPDATNMSAMLSATTSFTKLPKIFNTGIKIGDSISDIQHSFKPKDVPCLTKDIQHSGKNCNDFGTSTNECTNAFKTISPRTKSVGIRIKDSDTNIRERVESGTMTLENEISHAAASIPHSFDSATETRLLKPVSSRIKMEDSGSEFCESVGSFRKSQYPFANLSKNTSDSQMNSVSFNKRLPIRNANLKKIIKDDAPKQEDKKSTRSNECPKTVKFNRNVTKVSTKLVASSVLTKPNKPSFVTKKPSMTSATCVVKKDGEKPIRCCKKSYLPVYLKRKLAIKNTNNNLIQQSESSNTITETKPIVQLPDVVESIINDDNKKELLDAVDFEFEPRENVSYVIFRNEIETNKSTPVPESSLPPRECLRRRDNTDKRSPSPQSQNSSACSSPNSIATVRARPASKNTPDRRFSTSSNKSNLSNSASETTPVKTKKFTKRAKTNKKPQEKEYDNKENVPESSRKSKESERSPPKTAFMRNKNVFRAHVTAECSPQTASTLSRHRPQTANKSNVRIPTVPCSSEKPASSTSSRPSVSKKSLPKSRTSLHSENKSDRNLNKSDLTSLGSPPQNLLNASSEDVTMNIVDNSLLSEWMNSTYKSVIESHTSNILAAMRQLVEERLDFIERLSDNCLEVDSKTVVLSEDQLESLSVSASTSFHDSSSLNNSFGTVIAKEDDLNSVDINDIQNIVNNTLDSVLGNESIVSLTDSRRTTTDLDLLSFKSLTSASKISEYFLAESSLNNITESLQNTRIPVTGSLRDLFERRKQLTVQNPGALAVQAFSGFSMNIEPVAGDQPDHINIIDSETGSLALEFTRQATSEEVFISGRSSSSYESCLIDEDTVVPYWLFQIISQQQSVDEEEEDEPEELLPIPVPLPEPMYDVNGNVLEAGPGAGAGDGRGIHSDHSQDSSGRGTSLSSSATSSGPQSEHYRCEIVALLEPMYDVNGNVLEAGAGDSRGIHSDHSQDSSGRGTSLSSSATSSGPQSEHYRCEIVALLEPIYDVNGNVLEAGPGAGAGDGHGIHSDHSQDSSGRGTSLKSSATSSGPQSEMAILIDPSAFTAHYDLTREPVSSSVIMPIPLPLESPETSYMTADDTARTNDILNSSGEGCERATASLLAASDADADVSSTDTDVPDSSDN